MTSNSTPQDCYTVSTHGWDTAFVIPISDVNKAIIDKKSSPLNFQYSDSTASLSGNFGDWQITQGGDGKNIRFSIPMMDIVLEYLATKKKVTVNSGIAIVEIELEYLPHEDSSDDGTKSTGNGKPMALKPQLTSDQPPAPVFFVVALELTPPPSGIVTQAVIQSVFQEWGNANLGQFNHIFAVVDLNRLVDQGQWGFVTPNYTSYAYLDGKTLDDSLFSVLSMTGDRTGTDLNEQVAFNAIPSDSIAGFLISQARTLYDLVRPAVMQAYSGLTDSNFLMNASQETLYLTDDTSVSLKPVSHNGSTYYPKLTNLSLQSNGSLFTLNSHTTTEIVAGITAECQATHWYTLQLGTSSKGQTLTFTEFQSPNIVHSISQSPGSHLTQIIIDIVLAVVLIILTILTDGAALIVGGLAIGLLLGADQIVPPLIEQVNKDDSPAIDLLQVNAVDPITWPNSKVFQLKYGQLNMSLQLGGDPGFL